MKSVPISVWVGAAVSGALVYLGGSSVDRLFGLWVAGGCLIPLLCLWRGSQLRRQGLPRGKWWLAGGWLVLGAIALFLRLAETVPELYFLVHLREF